MHKRQRLEYIHEGKYAAQVPIDWNYDEDWVPTMSADSVQKLDTVRLALRRGDIAEAARHGRVFELTPVVAK